MKSIENEKGRQEEKKRMDDLLCWNLQSWTTSWSFSCPSIAFLVRHWLMLLYRMYARIRKCSSSWPVHGFFFVYIPSIVGSGKEKERERKNRRKRQVCYASDHKLLLFNWRVPVTWGGGAVCHRIDCISLLICPRFVFVLFQLLSFIRFLSALMVSSVRCFFFICCYCCFNWSRSRNMCSEWGGTLRTSSFFFLRWLSLKK